MMRVLREPLLHFLLLGAGLFLVYLWVNPQTLADDSKVVIDQGRVLQLTTRFERTWSREPTAQELQTLIDNFIVEEVLYRQALAMGLDTNDSVIRRRLRQKMEFLAVDAMDLYEPTTEQLQTYLEQHPQRFMRDAVFSFEQIYIHTDRPAEALQRRIQQVQQQLRQGDTVTGTHSLLPSRVEQTPASQVDRSFGSGFAAQLQNLRVNQWSDPIQSGLGVHFVRLRAVQPAALPALADVRDHVRREWQNTKNQQLKTALLEELKSQYTIIIEPGAASAALENI